MRYYKIVKQGYIVGIGMGAGGVEITADEYSTILNIIQNKPTTSPGYDYLLTEDLTWEQIQVPIVDYDDEINDSDILADFMQGKIEGAYESDKITILKLGAFAQCTGLSYVSLPNCVQFSSYRTFFDCNNITAINLPKLETIVDGTYTFGQMRKLQEISLPSLKNVSTFNATFDNCQKVWKISLPKLSGVTIGTNAFNNCYALHTLILGGSTLNPLGNTSAFNGAGAMAGKTLSIYVPDDLVDSYKTAPNWSTMADKIKPISELEE